MTNKFLQGVLTDSDRLKQRLSILEQVQLAGAEDSGEKSASVVADKAEVESKKSDEKKSDKSEEKDEKKSDKSEEKAEVPTPGDAGAGGVGAGGDDEEDD